MRLGDLDALKEELKNYFSDGILDSVSAKLAFNMILRKIDDTPTIIRCSKTPKGYPLMDLRPREKGEWAFDEKGNFYCDQCKKYPHDQYATTDFCPNCGACMQEGGVE